MNEIIVNLNTQTQTAVSLVNYRGGTMFDDLAAYFVENVLAAYREFSDSLRSEVYGKSNDLRLAVNAAVALYHMREHFPSGAQKTRTQLAAICPDYDLLGDIVNAAKHQTLTRGTPRFTAASD